MDIQCIQAQYTNFYLHFCITFNANIWYRILDDFSSNHTTLTTTTITYFYSFSTMSGGWILLPHQNGSDGAWLFYPVTHCFPSTHCIQLGDIKVSLIFFNCLPTWLLFPDTFCFSQNVMVIEQQLVEAQQCNRLY